MTGKPIRNLEDARDAAKAIVAMGPRAAVVKGGHLPGEAVDTFYDGLRFMEFHVPRIETRSTHGTGCTFASAIAAGLAQGLDLERAIAQAKEYVTQALKQAYPLGHGHGPVHHFYNWWE